MCGIAGVVSFTPGQGIDREELTRINQHMQNRGPDHTGFWYSSNQQIGLAHNRLAIIDPDHRSNGPMEYLDGRYVITYNGEIYNYPELRSDLIQQGYSFRTCSDTEVIMALYDCYGVAMLDRLRGMFAFALWDSKYHKLIAARDPFGIKPLYYYKDQNKFLLASQVKGLSNGIKVGLTPGSAGWCGFFKYGSVPEPFTIYEQIACLPAGSYLELNLGGTLNIIKYFCIYNEYVSLEGQGKSEPDLERVEQAISESVNTHLVSDVPVGLFLSAGLDSNMIAWYARNPDLVAYTLDFREFGDARSESLLAAQAAQSYGIEHRIIEYGQDDAKSMLEDFFKAMDQPSIDGLNVWMISKVVSEAGYKTVLSGLGGDEVLAGYPSFRQVPRIKNMSKFIRQTKPVHPYIEKLLNTAYANQHVHPKLRGIVCPRAGSYLGAYYLKRGLFLDFELDQFFEPAFVRHGREQLFEAEKATVNALKKLSNPYLIVSALELDKYMKNQLLRDADWASMSHSLEIRVPFVDRELICTCAGELAKFRAPDKISVTKKIMGKRLPESILARAKTGFETPVKHWLDTMTGIQGWKNQDDLAHDNCPWARRWAYELKSRFFQTC